MPHKPLRILTWHVHGTYLYYLSQCPHEFYLPKHPARGHGYGGIGGPFPWGPNVHEIPADELRRQAFDVVIFQARAQYERDQYEFLTPAQRRLPRIYIEHDPPREHPTDTRHPVDDPNVLLVHVTAFNDLMWDSGRTPTCVIDHGVKLTEDARYNGELPRGLVVVNNLKSRGRRLGADIYARVAKEIPLDLVGMGASEMGGFGEVPYDRLAGFMARYRFFFNPIRYTSLGLAVLEAMHVGLPVVGLATTEMVTAIKHGETGYVATDVEQCIAYMRELLRDRDKARRLGEAGRAYARERFSIERFVRDWNATLYRVSGSDHGEARAAI